jgi:flagellar protein FliS
MLQQSQRDKYRENSLKTATPAQLLIMLFEGAIRFCKISIEAIHKQDHETAHRNLIKVQDIINEFIITLDKNAPMAGGLLQLYDYFIFRLTEANVKKETAPIEEVLGHLVELKQTWIQAALSAKESASQPAASTSNNPVLASPIKPKEAAPAAIPTATTSESVVTAKFAEPSLPTTADTPLSSNQPVVAAAPIVLEETVPIRKVQEVSPTSKMAVRTATSAYAAMLRNAGMKNG